MEYTETAEKVMLLDIRPIEKYEISFGESKRGISLLGTARALDWFHENYVKRSHVQP